MAIIGNKLYRNVHTKQEESADIDQQLSRMEDDIRKLKIDFDIFFNGATKRPPLVSRFTSYRELWRRTLKAKGEELA